jgi:hypothetical protein
MKNILFALGMLFAGSVQAQVSRLPLSDDGYYVCFAPSIGYTKNGAWMYYICDPYGKSPITAKSHVVWIAAANPVRFDLIGNRMETIKNNADPLAAANKAWARYVNLPPNDPLLGPVKADMIKAGAPIAP